MTKNECEAMLEKEAERVAKSILQLINSMHFTLAEDSEKAKVMRKFSNKIAFAMKKNLTDEITKQFLKD